MGKLQTFEILFANNIDLFKPGDTIKGEVRIILTGEKGDVRGIKVACKGKADTHWSESKGSRRHRRSVHYSWKISYFKQDIILRGADKNNQVASRLKLPVGDHYFPFEFQIPARSLPPPFEGTVGFVRYYIKATIDRPWKFDHKVTRYFSIWTVKDLNTIPNILVIPSVSATNTVCCLCCESGPVTLRVSLDKRGYIPGESILITIELNNRCGRELISLVSSLHQSVVYQAKHGNSVHTRRSAGELAELRLEGSSAEGLVTYHRKPMVIPAVPPNNFEYCPNIDVTYSVRTKADLSGTPIDVSVEIPIIIGTTPALAQNAHPSLHPPQPGQSFQHQGYPPPQGHQPSPPNYQQYAAGHFQQHQGYNPGQVQQYQQTSQHGYTPNPGAPVQYPPHWSQPPQAPQGQGAIGFQAPPPQDQGVITSQPHVYQQDFSYPLPAPHQQQTHHEDIELREYHPTDSK